MPELPNWAVEVLKQSPILAVALGVAWVAGKYITNLHAAHLKQIQERFDLHLSQLRESCDKHLTSKESEIKRLVAELKARAEHGKNPERDS